MDLSAFLPHSVCLALDPVLLALHAASDAVTAIAYYSIPLALLVFAYRRRSLRYRWVVLLFAAFVLACGTTHAFGLVTLWVPAYWAQGVVKAVTALVSIATAILLWPLIPRVLAMPSPEELEREVAERKMAEAAVRLANAELELRVHERTVELLRMKDAAERADTAKSAFLAAASHDLRQPFQALRLYVDVMRGKTVGGELEPVVERANQALEAGEGLLHALLDLSTLQAGMVTAKPEPMPLRDLLERLDAEWGPVAAQQGLELRVVPTTLVVESDPVLLARLVRNLIANALRYTQSGRVVVGCRRDGADGVSIEVWDTGIGIPADALEDIFEEFTQLGNPERDRSRGLGLGLAVVRRLAELLGGRVTVRSIPGKGSVFRFQLPRRASSQTPSTAGAAASA